MSARWRRNRKDLDRFNIFKALGKEEDDSPCPLKNPKSRKWSRSNRFISSRVFSKKQLKDPDPLIDILEEDDKIVVFAEFAGFNSENLKIRVKDQRLTLSAQSQNRRYYKSLNLPKRVIPRTVRTTCKNGVLEIHMEKAVEEKTINKVAG